MANFDHSGKTSPLPATYDRDYFDFSGPFYQANYEEQHHGTEECDSYASDEPTTDIDVEPLQKMATNDGTDDAYNDVPEQSETTASHNQPAQPSGYCTNDQEVDDLHFSLNLLAAKSRRVFY